MVDADANPVKSKIKEATITITQFRFSILSLSPVFI
jgi:hypothetical protein